MEIKKLPIIFKNVVRKRYFEIFKIFTSDAGLVLDVENYKDDVIVDRNFRKNFTGIIAIIESHSKWGEPDDLTSERKKRKYDGLRIHVTDSIYLGRIEKIADKMKRNIEEDVVLV